MSNPVLYETTGNYQIGAYDKFIAIIGSRNATQAECHAAYHLAKKAASKGNVVVSGLAVGVDAAAHLGALDAGGVTIAVVNTPKKQAGVYPSANQPLADRIIQSGCLFHPFRNTDKEEDANQGKPTGLSRFARRLIERDIVVAAISTMVIAVKDGGIISGGSKWATNYGKRYEKNVFRFDSSGTFHPNPESERSSVWWEPEIDFDQYLNHTKKTIR